MTMEEGITMWGARMPCQRKTDACCCSNETKKRVEGDYTRVVDACEQLNNLSIVKLIVQLFYLVRLSHLVLDSLLEKMQLVKLLVSYRILPNQISFCHTTTCSLNYTFDRKF